jgi:Tfp pilus assembly PilM family ATPase
MGFFSTQASPIAIDFGTSSVKLLQMGAGANPRIVAAAELPVPDHLRTHAEGLSAYYTEQIPRLLTEGGFKSRRAIIASPSSQTFIQHMQLPNVQGANQDDLIMGQLQTQTGCVPQNVVVRSIEVADARRSGQPQNEVICFAIARDTVMRYIEILRRCKLKVVGVHTEAMALVRAFDYLNRRHADDDRTTLYVDMGWAGTMVTIAHGRDIQFARHIQVGGRNFDQQIASTMKCEMAEAREHRLALEDSSARLAAMKATVTNARAAASEGAAVLSTTAAQASGDDREGQAAPTATRDEDRRERDVPSASCLEVPSGEPPRIDGRVDLTELVDTITDELSMCLRYHQGLFPDRAVNRAIFVGGESRQVWLCQHVVKALDVPAQLGDPLNRVAPKEPITTPGLDLGAPQPGWAVAFGLSSAPTDL